MVDFYPSITENLLNRCMEAMTVQKYTSSLVYSSDWGRIVDYHRDDNLAVVIKPNLAGSLIKKRKN